MLRGVWFLGGGTISRVVFEGKSALVGRRGVDIFAVLSARRVG